MATAPTPGMNPGAAPQPGAAPGASGQQANPLQQALAQIMQIIQKLGMQNELIQPEMQEAAGSIRKAFLKTIQAAPQPPQAASAPPGQ